MYSGGSSYYLTFLMELYLAFFLEHTPGNTALYHCCNAVP